MTNTQQPMRLVATQFGYSFYTGINRKGQPYYNVVPQDQPKPGGGYMRAEYICKIKNVPNLFETL